ncbi:hypothetical protein F4804DRAFT_214502 [Jackrogersella minutella]|nr:hypothetical protein F4804DRAFT_214502 [Jackrogersella minutella]
MPLHIPHPNTPLHLYRHLLREATYLPPLCRPWITQRIQGRFRDCSHKEDPKPHIKDAHHHLRFIRSANAGHVKRMLRLCFMASGRVGKRRRLLGRSELGSSPPTSSAELDKSTTLTNDKDRPPDWIDNWSIEKILAIARSQIEQQTNDSPHQMRRLIDPSRALPTENIFGRPLAKKLARNKLKRHWARVLHQLLPPLPQGEWDQLALMTRGEADPQHYKIPKRRPVAQSRYAGLDTKRWSWTDFVTKPIRSMERKSSRKMKSLSGSEDEDPRGHGRPIGVRVLGKRRLRRSIYTPVWEASPMIGQNPRSGKMVIKWGNQEKPISPARKRDLQFFQGLNKAGVPTVRRFTMQHNTIPCEV